VWDGMGRSRPVSQTLAFRISRWNFLGLDCSCRERERERERERRGREGKACVRPSAWLGGGGGPRPGSPSI
jgi:hypothetical protein